MIYRDPLKKISLKKYLGSRVTVALILLGGVFLVGILGYKLFSGYTWTDAIYMTVITITTIGFGEVQQLSPQEKLLTSVYIICSIFFVGYAISVITEYMLSKNNIGNLRAKKVKSKIDALKDHIIVCGYGRNGNQAVSKLLAYNKNFVVIDHDEKVLEPLYDSGMLYINGNATEDEVLKEAGIERASTLMCTLPGDADNVFIVLSAKQLNEKLKIISRATKESTTYKLKLAGADNVIMPDKIGGDHMASLVVTPDLVEFLGHLSVSRQEGSINIEEMDFDHICTDGQEHAIKELDLRKKTGCTVIGYRAPDGNYSVNPDPDMIIRKNSKLIFIGKPEQIEKLKQTYKD
ncbi:MULTISPECIES: potassium channel family protein [Mesonia]|uniref:Voltage-gated potassium channel Kch n=1 Tax=Mesonia oceanica TaxID=2687242 RepID=A0AC61Y9R3_9FLAO|nr:MULTISPECIES: potassium channel protein [Mesonia]VVV01247.1 Voltage-gated potassium channel Kch [Mesonia oceanica]